MRVTVCELPHEPVALAAAWERLCKHVWWERSELLLLPEFAMLDPVWEGEQFEEARWAAALLQSEAWLWRLDELGAEHVVGTRPVEIDGRRLNQGYIWSTDGGVKPLRSKYFLPDEPGGRESRWFDRGDAAFPAFDVGGVKVGVNICTELWALESYGVYAGQGVEMILSPRATGAATVAKWLSVGVVAAVRSGAFSVSSNRVDPVGVCGGVGWIISPQGKVVATTSREEPFATVDIDLAVSAAARTGYPCSVFG